MALERLEIRNPVGVNKSLEAEQLPKGVWSDVRNVSFKNGKVSKAQGFEEVFQTPPPSDVISLLPLVSNDIPVWFEATPTHLFVTQGTTHTDVSRTVGGPYTATESIPWYGAVLNQVVIFNNFNDKPQSLLPTGTDFTDLPNWPATTRAKVIRSFKNYLVAMNLSKAGTEFPNTVKWSSPADPGQVPFTWDETDPTNDAGENSLADTPGQIVDGRKLKDNFIIYKEDSVYSMRYVGGVFVFAFQQLFDDIGMIAPTCVAEFEGKHFVVGYGDIYVHNGVQKKSVIDGVLKEYFFNTIKQEAFKRVFVIPDYNRTEMWVCFPTTDNVDNNYCNQAIVYNWSEETWTIRDVPYAYFGTFGIVDPQQSNAWDDDGAIWDTDTTVWNDGTYNPAKTRILLTSPLTDKIYLVGNTSLFGTSMFTSRVERVDISLSDDHSMKFLSSFTPHMTGTGTATFYLGSSYIQGGPVTWRGPFPFTIGQDYKVDCRVNGRYLAIRMEAGSEGAWAFSGYTLELAPAPGSR